MSRKEDLIKFAQMAEQKGDIEAAKKALMEADTIEDNKDFSTLEMVKNIPSSALQYGKDVYQGVKQAVTSPLETGSAISDLASGMYNKTVQYASDKMPDDFVESMNRAQNKLVDQNFLGSGLLVDKTPVKKEDMQYKNIPMADAYIDYMKGRVGSMDAIKQTAMKDPVGLLGDLSMVSTGAGGLIGGAKGAKLGAALEPINLTKNVAQKAMGLIPEKMPNDMYKSAVKFSTVLDENLKTGMAKTGLLEGIMPTGKGIQKAKGIAGGLDDIINSLIDSSVKSGEKIPVNAVFAKLKELRRKKGGAKAEAKTDLANIDKAAKEFGEYMKEKGQTHMTVREMQDFKINLTKKIYKDKIALKTIPEKDEIRAAMADASRESIANKVPEVRDINKRESNLLQLVKGLDRPAGRIDNLNYFGIDPALKGGTGYMLAKGAGISPEVGTALGVGSGLLGAPKNKARMAIFLDKLRRQGGTKGLLTSDPMVRSILQEVGFQSGRADREGLLTR